MRSFVLSALVLASTTACAGVHGSGTIVRTQAPKLEPFTEVDVSGGLEVTVRKGSPSVVLEGDDNIVAQYEVGVVGERLRIRPRGDVSLRPSRAVKAWVTVPVLKKLEAAGGVDVVVESGVEKDLSLDLAGGVDFRAASLELAALQVEASGGVKLALAGVADQASFELTGGVEMDAAHLSVQTVKLEASGGCDLDLTATQAISGEASGGVDVTVRGNPPKSRLQSSGGTSVRWAE
jgi:hypothetical protein